MGSSLNKVYREEKGSGVDSFLIAIILICNTPFIPCIDRTTGRRFVR